MQALTEAGQRALQELSLRYGVSTDAVHTLLLAVAAGSGTMAQFYHHELGGGGQWMRGGMTMVGDMFNTNLQNLVNNLCTELADRLQRETLLASGSSAMGGGNWWPAELGQPAASGGQNQMRYAYFPAARSLAVDTGGGVELYDTGEHQIGGVSQQQSGSGYSLSFTSQFGTFGLTSLPRADGGGNAAVAAGSDSGTSTPQQPGSDEILQMLARLGELRDRNVLTQAEFEAKKAELLARL